MYKFGLRRIVACAMATCLLIVGSVAPLAAASVVGSELIVSSPFFGDGISSESASMGIQTYSQQLGILSDLTVALTPEERILMAVSSDSYPVTPGDLYGLTYINGQNTISYELQVDGALSITIPGVGTVSGVGRTYPQMKMAIENLVLTYHPYAMPQCKLMGTGVFTVVVRGEVMSTQRFPSWGLSRLSSLAPYASSYASTRAVQVIHKDGTTSTYDLFTSLRSGDLSQDPLLAPGDIVQFPKATRLVTLGGEVYRPGTYQPLADQQLSALLDIYGGGLIPSADMAKIRVERFDPVRGTWDALFVNARTDGSFLLQNLDRVYVEKLIPTAQTVSVEGAIATDSPNDTSVSSLTNQTSGKMFYQFYPGEQVSDFFRSISSRFNATSDLESIYLVRGSQMIPLNAQNILYGNGEGGDLVLQGGDRFVVPFNQMFVIVSGAVAKSGTYAYVPDRPVSYYLAQAGGMSSDAKKSKMKITDAQGNKLEDMSIVPPNSVITVERNTISNDLSVTVAVIGIVSSVVSIAAMVVSLLSDAKVI